MFIFTILGGIIMLLSEAWKLYEKDKKYLGYSPNTLEAYGLYHRLLIRECGDLKIDDLTYEVMKEYIYGLTDRLKPSSLSIRARHLRSFLGWAHEEGHVPVNESAKLKAPRTPLEPPKPLTMYEIETIRDACETTFERSFFEFLYATGCRIGEVYKMNKDDINWRDRSVIVDGKGNKRRTVYFNLKCEIWLGKYLDERTDNQEALFVTERSYRKNDNQPRRISRDGFRWTLKRIAKRAGITKSIYPHNLRHSFAMNLLENGAPMEAIQDFLGHTNIEHTKVYAQLTTEMKKNIYDKYN